MEWLFLAVIVLGFIVFTALSESALTALIGRIVAAFQRSSSNRNTPRSGHAESNSHLVDDATHVPKHTDTPKADDSPTHDQNI